MTGTKNHGYIFNIFLFSLFVVGSFIFSVPVTHAAILVGTGSAHPTDATGVQNLDQPEQSVDVTSGLVRYMEVYFEYDLSSGVSATPFLFSMGGTGGSGCDFGTNDSADWTSGHHAKLFLLTSLVYSGGWTDTGSTCDLSTRSDQSLGYGRTTGSLTISSTVHGMTTSQVGTFPQATGSGGTINGFNLAFDLCDASGCSPAGPAPDTSATQFYSFTPTLGTTTVIATSSSMLFEATGYVVPQDWRSGDYVFLQFGVNPNVAGPLFALSYALSPATYQEFEYPLSSSGAFTASTTIDASAAGVIPVYWSIKHCGWTLFGICFGLSSTVVYSSFLALGTTTQAQYDATIPVVTATAGALSTFSASSTLSVNTTATSTVYAQAFGLTGVILGKFPFNWVVDYANVLSNLGSSTGQLGSTTVDQSHVISYTGVPTVSMDFRGLSLLNKPFASSTASTSLVITMFSATTLNQVAAIGGIQTMRLFISWFLWIELVMYAWRRATGLFFEEASARA